MQLFIYKLPLGIVILSIIVSSIFWGVLNAILHRKSGFNKYIYIANAVLSVLSLFIIISFTFLNRTQAASEVNLKLLSSLEEAKNNPEIYRTMLMNVALFFPLGLFLANSLSNRIPIWLKLLLTVIVGISLSVIIEFLQYKYSLGQCEIDDILCNSLGGLIGALSLFFGYIFKKIQAQPFYDNQIAKYLLITFLISWISWGILSIVVSPEYYFSFKNIIKEPLHIIGGFGPIIALYLINKEKISLKNYFKVGKSSIKTLGIFSILEVAIFGLSSMEVNTSLPIFLIPLVFVQATLIYGGNEELGWRGYLQPNLERYFSFPIATIITGIVWALWHLPLWFVNGASQQNMNFGLFLVFSVILSFWLGSIFKKTNSSFYCALFHGLTNTILSVFVVKINFILIIGLIILTAYSIYNYKRA